MEPNQCQFIILFGLSCTTLLTSIVAIATALYTVITLFLFLEARKTRQEQREPRISVTFQPREDFINWLDMIIQNIGGGTAYNVKFSSSSNFELIKGKNFLDLGFMKNGIRYLVQNQKIQFFFTNMAEDTEKKKTSRLEIEVAYQTNDSKTNRIFNRNLRKDKFTVDFSELLGLLQAGKSPLRVISDSVDKIQSDIASLVSKSDALPAAADSLDEIRSDIEQLISEIHAMRIQPMQKTPTNNPISPNDRGTLVARLKDFLVRLFADSQRKER